MEMLHKQNRHMLLLKDNRLNFIMYPFQKSYRAELMIEEDNNNKTRITHGAFVKTMEVVNHDVYIVSVTLYDFLINNQPPDLLLEQLADKCRKAFEIVVFYVSKNWELIGIHNHREIVDNWNKIRGKLEQEYTGDIVTNYISRHEQVLLNHDLLLQKLRQDTFISQLFCPVYGSTYNDFAMHYKEPVRFLNINYDIDVTLTVNETIAGTDEADIREVIVIKKTIDDKVYKNHEMPIDNYNVLYTLNEDFSIASIKGKFENYGRKFTFDIIENIVL